MNLHPIDYLIIVAFVLVTLLIGWRAGRKIKTFREYALGQAGGYGTLALTLTYLATNIGPGNLASAKDYATTGLIEYIAFGIGPAIGMLIEGVLFPRYISHFKGCTTLGEVMGKLYGRGVRILTGILGALYCILLVATGFSVFGTAITYLLGWNKARGILFVGLLLTLYTAHGGMKAVTSTDIFQFLILIVALPLLLHVVWHHLGGTENIIAKLPEAVIKQTDGGVVDCKDHLEGCWHPQFFKYLGYFLVWSLPTGLTTPEIFQRALMAKNARTLRNQYFWSALMHAMITGVFFLFGLAALVKYNTGDSPLDATKMFVVPQLIQDYSITGITGLWLAGVMAVIIAGTDSPLQTAGVTLFQDVWVPLVGKKRRIRGAQVATLVMGLVALGLSLYAHSVGMEDGKLNLDAIDVVGPVLLFPLVAGLVKLKTDVYSFCASAIVAIAAYLGAYAICPDFEVPISIIAGALGFMMVHFHRHGGLAWAKRPKEVVLGIPKKSWRKRVRKWLSPYSTFMQPLRYGSPYLLFGIFFCVNFILPYFMWPASLSHKLGLWAIFIRLIGALCCGLLIIHQQWPPLLKRKVLVPFWYFTLTYCLPFTSTLMLLLTEGNHGWLVNVAMLTILLFLLVDGLMALVLTLVGSGTAMVLYLLAVDSVLPTITLADQSLLVYQLIFGTLIGLIFTRRKSQVFQLLSTRHEHLQKHQISTTQRLVEVLQQDDRLGQELGKGGVSVDEMVTATGQRLLKGTLQGQEAERTGQQLLALGSFLKEAIYRSRYYMQLKVETKPFRSLMKEILMEVRNTYPSLRIETQLPSPKVVWQGDASQLRQLLYNALGEAWHNGRPGGLVQLGVLPAQLNYELASIKGYVKPVQAWQLVVTTEDSLPSLPTVYHGDLSSAMVAPLQDAKALPRLLNKRIVDAHYGVVAYHETENGRTQIYVLPARVRDIRPKNMDHDPREAHQQPVSYPDAALLERQLLTEITEKAPHVVISKVQKALELIKQYHAGQKRKSGEPFYFHPIEVTRILLQYTDEEDTLLAGLLHDIVEDTSMSVAQLDLLFGEDVSKLVHGVTHLDHGTRRILLTKYENLQKLMETSDPRILLIKLADRIHNMKTIEGHPSYAKQLEKTEETLQFFVPIAQKINQPAIVEQLRALCFEVIHRGMITKEKAQ